MVEARLKQGRPSSSRLPAHTLNNRQSRLQAKETTSIPLSYAKSRPPSIQFPGCPCGPSLLAVEKRPENLTSRSQQMIKLDRFSSPAWQAGMKRGRSLNLCWVTHSGILLRGGPPLAPANPPGLPGCPTDTAILVEKFYYYRLHSSNAGTQTMSWRAGKRLLSQVLHRAGGSFCSALPHPVLLFYLRTGFSLISPDQAQSRVCGLQRRQ